MRENPRGCRALAIHGGEPSAALIISISEDLPKEIEAMNRYRNAAAVSVKTAEDMRKVEEAIKKISGIL
jgi:hypothetical protein